MDPNTIGGILYIFAGVIFTLASQRLFNIYLGKKNPYHALVRQGYQEKMLHVYQQILEAHRHEFIENNHYTTVYFIVEQLLEVLLKEPFPQYAKLDYTMLRNGFIEEVDKAIHKAYTKRNRKTNNP